MLIAASAIGAAVAGIILVAKKRRKQSRELSAQADNNTQLVERNPIHAMG